MEKIFSPKLFSLIKAGITTELTLNFSGFTSDSSEKSAFCSNRYK
jgi:hypothetical protein